MRSVCSKIRTSANPKAIPPPGSNALLKKQASSTGQRTFPVRRLSLRPMARPTARRPSRAPACFASATRRWRWTRCPHPASPPRCSRRSTPRWRSTRCSKNSSAAAMVEAFLNRRSQRRATRHAGWTAALYAEAAAVHPTPFWRARAQPPPEPPHISPLQLDQPIGFGTGVGIRDEPCPIGNRIEMRRVIAPPGAAEPVAFADGVEIAPLFDALRPDATVRETLTLWSRHVGEAQAARLFAWAWRSGWLAPVPQRNISDAAPLNQTRRETTIQGAVRVEDRENGAEGEAVGASTRDR